MLRGPVASPELSASGCARRCARRPRAWAGNSFNASICAASRSGSAPGSCGANSDAAAPCVR